MYLVDLDIIWAARRRRSDVDSLARKFLQRAVRKKTPLFLSVVTLGDLHRIGRRSDASLAYWLKRIAQENPAAILPFDHDTAVVAGQLRACRPALRYRDSLVAATALIFGISVVRPDALAINGEFEPGASAARPPAALLLRSGHAAL